MNTELSENLKAERRRLEKNVRLAENAAANTQGFSEIQFALAEIEDAKKALRDFDSKNK